MTPTQSKFLSDLHGSSFDYLIITNFVVYELPIDKLTEVTQQQTELTGSHSPPPQPLPEIIDIPWIVLDLHTALVVDQQQMVVKPHTGIHLTEELESRLGIKNSLLSTASNLQDVLNQFDEYINAHFLAHNKTFCFLTDGPNDFERIVRGEAHAKRINLAPYFGRYFDIRSEFEKCFPHMDEPASLDDIVKYFEIHLEQERRTGLEDCRLMSIIVNRLLQNGHRFVTPEAMELEKIPQEQIQSISSKSPNEQSSLRGISDENWTVRLRGLPWDATDQHIRMFFDRIRIPYNGITFTFNHQGRPSGEAYVRFTSEDDHKLALLHHKKIMGKRYIEVFRVNNSNNNNQDSTSNNRVYSNAEDRSSPEQLSIVRMRGIPSCSSLLDLEQFFDGFTISKEHIHMVRNGEEQFVGEAFVEFESQSAAEKAVDALDKKVVGGRLVELFPCNNTEMMTVIQRWSELSCTSYKDLLDEVILDDALSSTYSSYSAPHSHHEMPLHPPHDYIHTSPENTDGHRTPTSSYSHDDYFNFAEFDESTAIRLRNLPLSVSEQDIIEFFGDTYSSIAPNGIHILHNAQDRPTGEVYVEFLTEADCVTALTNHKPAIYDRNVELSHCTRGEMLMALGYFCYQSGVDPTMDIPVMDIHPPRTSHESHAAEAHHHESILAAPETSKPDSGPNTPSLFSNQAPNSLLSQMQTHFGTASVSMPSPIQHQVQTHILNPPTSFAPVQGLPQPQSQNMAHAHSHNHTHAHNHIHPHSHIHGVNAASQHHHTSVHSHPHPIHHGHHGHHSATHLISNPIHIQHRLTKPKLPLLQTQPIQTHGHGNGPNILRMRGLPFRATPDSVLAFFSGYGIIRESIIFGVDRIGRPSGEAWVTFETAEEVQRAFHELNHKHMGSRYIELFL